jgi:hypothetical protein
MFPATKVGGYGNEVRLRGLGALKGAIVKERRENGFSSLSSFATAKVLTATSSLDCPQSAFADFVPIAPDFSRGELRGSRKAS